MKNTKIEWCENTFNPWVGCSPVSAGCAHCYAAAMWKRWGKEFAVRTRTSAAYWKQPLRWNAEAKRRGKMATVFCGSMCDWLDLDAPGYARGELTGLITSTPHLFWMLLTKRPENLSNEIGCLPFDMSGYPNVGMGVTVENQAMADKRIPLLLKIPARMRFVSVEPMLGPVDLQYAAFNGADSLTSLEGIDWVICGAETGPQARIMKTEWAYSLRDQCRVAGVPFFFKKWSQRTVYVEKMPREFPDILQNKTQDERKPV